MRYRHSGTRFTAVHRRCLARDAQNARELSSGQLPDEPSSCSSESQMTPHIHGEGASRKTYSNEGVSTLPGIWKYPTFRDDLVKSGPLWIQGRRKDEDIGDLWRVHDGLYDFSAWLNNHPGGADWLCMTQGTDITEVFEAHHISQMAEYLLPHFFVRKTSVPRNSPYSFNKDGFYYTLKTRAREVLKGKKNEPMSQSKVTADLLLAGTLLTAVLAGHFWSFSLGITSGIFLSLTTICGHNFFHQKNNIRMYYFDISLMSSRHWRISHAMSHHMFPNSVHDLELALFEPFVQFLPKTNKTILERYGPWFYSPFVYAGVFPVQFLARIMCYFKKIDAGPRIEDLIPLIIPSVIYIYGGCGMQHAIIMWLWIIVVGSFTFTLIGIHAGHHHPQNFHDGDTPREDSDWGMQQLDTIQHRSLGSKSHFISLVSFGNHTLHHLFPTLDHGQLDLLMPTLINTCEEFNTQLKKNTVLAILRGQFQQCARNKQNLIPQGVFKQ